MQKIEQNYGRFELQFSKQLDRKVRKLYLNQKKTGKEFADSDLRAWIDLLVSGTLLVPAIPMIGILAIAIAAQDGHNPFFVAERIYSNGEKKSLYKLRTMHINANDRSVSPTHNGDANDPRVTKIGKLLRKINMVYKFSGNKFSTLLEKLKEVNYQWSELE